MDSVRNSFSFEIMESLSGLSSVCLRALAVNFGIEVNGVDRSIVLEDIKAMLLEDPE